MKVSERKEVIIIGGGPAGLSAAIWCADLGMEALVLEELDELGGQLLWIHNRITNYPGISVDNGRALRDRFLEHLRAGGIEIRTGTRLLNADLGDLRLKTAGGRHLSASAILIATGVRRRTLGIKGEDTFAGKGILDSGARRPEQVTDGNVIVVGGGDAATENAIILSKFARQVTLVHRGDSLSSRDEFVSKIARLPNVTLFLNTRVKEFVGDETLTGVRIEGRGNAPEYLASTHVLIRIGVEPNSEMFAGQLAMNEQNYLITDSYGKTNIPNVYAAGDVAYSHSPTISTAVGSAAAAVKCISSRLR